MRQRDFSRLVVRVAIVLAAAVVGQAFGQECDYGVYPYEYYNGGLNSGQPYPTIEAVCNAFVERDNAAGDFYVYALVSHSTLEGSGGTCVLSRHLRSDGTPATNVNRAFAARAGTICMPPPEEEQCEVEPYNFTAGNVAGPNRYCNIVEMCVMQVLSRTGDTMTIRNTGQTCHPDEDLPPPPDDMPEDPPDDGSGNETCQAVGDGQYCASASGDGDCGYFNDTYICLNEVRDDECKVMSDSSRICGQKASQTTPPAPDNGTPGQPAPPDGQISHETPGSAGPTTYNYFSGGTVAGSSRDPGSSGASASSGAGSPHAPGPGDADGDGQGDCEQMGMCDGDGDGEGEEEEPSPCYSHADGWLETVAVCASTAFSSVSDALYEESEWYALVSNLGSSIPTGGACPSAAFSAWGESYDFGDVACDMVEGARPTIGLMFLVLWSLVGVRVLIGTFAEA